MRAARYSLAIDIRHYYDVHAISRAEFGGFVLRKMYKNILEEHITPKCDCVLKGTRRYVLECQPECGVG